MHPGQAPAALSAAPAAPVAQPPNGIAQLAQWLHKLRQYPTKVTRVQKGDRSAHRPVPRPLVNQPDTRLADLGQRLGHVGHLIADVVHALAAPLEELADRAV